MSWKDAYRVRAGIVNSKFNDASTELEKANAQLSAAQLAQAGFRKDIKKDLIQPSKTEEQLTNEALDSTIKKGGFEGFLASVGKVAETPGIKTALNVLSTGTYFAANTVDNVVDGVNNLKDGNARGISDIAMAPLTGLGQGINAGIGQDKHDVKTFSEVIKHVAGDPQNDAEKWAQGIGGFIGDVGLDPTTYLTLGVSAGAKGAVRGAAEGAKSAKRLAEEAMVKAPEIADTIPAGATKTMREIAENPKGRIFTAIEEASKDHRSWKAARKQQKIDRKDIRARRNEEASNDLNGEFVGTDVAAIAKEQEALNAARVAEHQAELERQVEAEVASAPAPKVEDIKQEVIQDKLPEPEPIKIEEPTPVKVDTSVPVKFSEAVNDTIQAAPVGLPKPAAIDKTAQKISSLESAWMRPKYAKPGVVKELLNPGGAQVAKSIPASQLADPEVAAKYGIDPALYADPSTHYLPREVMEAAAGKAKGTREYSGGKLEAQANKDKKRAQANTATGKKNAKLKEETVDWDSAPQLSDPKYGVIIDEAEKPVTLTSENFKDYIDEDLWDNFVAENPDMLLSVRKKGISTSMKISALDNSIRSGHKLADEYIRQNLETFVPMLDDYAEYGDDINDLVAAWKKDHDAFTAPAKAAEEAKALSTETPDVDAPKLADDIIDDSAPLEARMIDVMENNPNVWSAERAMQLGIKADDHHLSPNEIAMLTIPMTNAEIKRAILKTDNMTKAQMDMLRDLTGKTTPEDIANEFVKLRMAYKKELKAAEKPAKIARQTKEEEVARTVNADEALRPIKPNDEHIESIKADTSELAEQFVKSPVAFDEPYQMELRRRSFVNALTDKTHGISDETLLKIVDPNTGRVGKLAINDYAHKAVKDALAVQLKEAPHKTDGGMRTMTTDITTGGAWSPKIWGSNSQQALHDSIIGAMLQQKNTGALNKFNATEQRKFYMATLKVADAELRAAGVEPFLNHIDDIPGKARTNVSLYDMFAALDENGMAIAVLDKHLFGLPSQAFNVTQLQGAFESMLRMRKAGKAEFAIKTRIKSQLTVSQAKHGRPINNDKAATDRTATRLGMTIDHNKSLEGLSATDAVRTAKRLDAVNANKVADALLDPGVYRSLSYRQMINTAAHNSSLGDFAVKYADDMVERLYKLSDTQGVGDALKFFTAETRRLNALVSPADYAKAKEALDLKLAEFVSEAERLGVNTTAKRTKIAEVVPPAPKPNATVTPTHAIEQAAAKSHIEDAKASEKEIAETPKPDDVEPFEMRAAEIANAAYRKMHPIQRLVNPRLGMNSDVYRAVNSGLHSIARQQAHFHQSLSMHLEKYSAQTLRTDFGDLQRLARNHDEKNPFTLPEDMSDSARELYGIMGTMLEVSNANVFARNAVGISHFNALAKHARMNDSWRFKEGLSIYDNTHLWAKDWEGIGEKGVLDFLSKMHSVSVKASQEIAIGASFSKNFGKSVKEEGYVKLSWPNQPKGNSSFFNLLDHSLYYPKDIAAQVIQVDKLMRESRSLDTSKPFGKFMVNVFDPITNALKASQTTVRPGHWSVSISGDLLRNQIAGVNSIQPYRHSVRIMKTAGLDPEDFIGKIDSAEALAKYRKSQEVSQGFIADGEATGMAFFVGNKKQNVSYETLEKILHDVVMLPKHRGGGGALEDRFVGEDITNKLSRKLEKATDFVTDNKNFSLNGMAAKRDNFFRIALAVDYASKRKWNNLTDMKKGMEEYVTKWAPISTDMTSFESKYARRTMLYYTWLRGITPRIIDAAVTKPGVATMMPKALYNMAYANGVNPESIGNPFPEDGLFPSYYYNNVLGPQWKDDYGMWGINPSSPVIEVANTFSKFTPGDPAGNVQAAGKQLLGMATPFAKMPIELSMGAQSSGVPIEDNNQYVLDNLGGSYLSTLSRATGKTINETGIVNRTDNAHKNSEEEQGQHAALQTLNFLTGGKLTDYQSDGAVKAAIYEIQEKQKALADAQVRKQ